jgi:hypothetical protein
VLKAESPAPKEIKTVDKALVAQATTPAQPALSAPPPEDPSGVHVTMEAPFVFSPTGPPPPKIPDPPPLERRQLASLRMVPPPGVAPPPPAPAQAAAPPDKKKAEKRGFFGRLRGFFASIFRG